MIRLSYSLFRLPVLTIRKTPSYKEIPDERFDAVMAYLREELHKEASGERPTQESLF